VPEIKPAYDRMYNEHRTSLALWSETDYEDFRKIARFHGTPEDVVLDALQYPRTNLVFENILLPFIIGLTSEPGKSQRLVQVMAWIEELAADEEFGVRNLVGTGFCEPLITNQEHHAASIIPLMGKATRQIGREVMRMFKVSEQTQRLLEAQ